MKKQSMHISRTYLRNNPTHIFVFGDNTFRAGIGGAAALRDEPNTLGFITKIRPDNNDNSFYKPDTYQEMYNAQISKLINEITLQPDCTFLISQLGAGLANRYGIWEAILKPSLETDLVMFDNVILLWD